MSPKILMAVTIFAAAPIVAFAQKDDPANQALKPTLSDAQKVVQTIRNDKAKLQAYCELGKLQDQMEKAEEGNDTKAVDALVAKADALAQQIGPEYLRIVEGLEEVDPSSAEGQKFAAVFNTLSDKCSPRSYQQGTVGIFVLIALHSSCANLVFRSLMET